MAFSNEFEERDDVFFRRLFERRHHVITTMIAPSTHAISKVLRTASKIFSPMERLHKGGGVLSPISPYTWNIIVLQEVQPLAVTPGAELRTLIKRHEPR